MIGGSWHGGRGIDCDFVSFSSLQTHLRCGRQKLWDTDQIVCRGREDKEPFDQVAPPMPGLAQAADRLDPTERLFDPLSLDHTDGIARMPGGTAIDGGAAIGVILRNMRCAASARGSRRRSRRCRRVYRPPPCCPLWHCRRSYQGRW